MHRPLQIWLFAVFVLCVIAAPFARGSFVQKAPIGGFIAFYCAGAALVERRDPYLVEPLRSCERASSFNFGAGLPEPAPLPPFMLLPFASLSLLPLQTAVVAYTLLLSLATGAAVWSLHRLTGFDIIFVTAALLVTDLYHNMMFGEIPPLIIGLLCVAGLLVERNKFVLAAFVAAAALVEPHAAAPALICMFIGLRRTRLPLVGIAIVLVAVSFATLGFAITLEYFTRVLPIHALSEVWANDQYSFTWIAHQAGFADVPAVRLGMASYVFMSALGIFAALRLAALYRKPSFIVLLPPAFAMIGGGFVHDLQIAIALPAIIVLLRVVAPALRLLTLLALVGLAAPWSTLVTLGLPVTGVLVWTSIVAQPLSLARRTLLTATICAGYVVILGALLALPDRIHGSFPASVPLPALPQDFASEIWGRFVRSSAYGQASMRTIVRKFPLWIALLLFAYTVQRALSSKRHSGVHSGQLPGDSISTPSPR